MSKRTQSIRSMFSSQPDEALSADNNVAIPRVTSGAVKSLKDTFSGVERDYQELRDRVASGAVAIDIDAALVDPSPFADRFTEPTSVSFEALKSSIAERGQEIPILVREHPTAAGRYQSAYGHRRVRALRELRLSVKAYVRSLSDEELVIAQGIENSAREDLSFIERAVFALRLEDGGFQRSVVQSALSIDRAEASKLIAVGKGVPAEIISAIGRAPKIGRGRWQSFIERLQEPGAIERVRELFHSEQVRAKETDERFTMAFAAAMRLPGGEAKPSSDDGVIARSVDGREIGKLTRSPKHCRIQLERAHDDAFADYLMRRLPELYQAYAEERSQEK